MLRGARGPAQATTPTQQNPATNYCVAAQTVTPRWLMPRGHVLLEGSNARTLWVSRHDLVLCRTPVRGLSERVGWANLFARDGTWNNTGKLVLDARHPQIYVWRCTRSK